MSKKRGTFDEAILFLHGFAKSVDETPTNEGVASNKQTSAELRAAIRVLRAVDKRGRIDHDSYLDGIRLASNAARKVAERKRAGRGT